MPRVSRDHGYSLIELMAVLQVVAVLIAMAILSLLRHREQAGDVETKSHVRSAAKAELLVHTNDSAFTAVPAKLAGTIDGIDVSGAIDESVHLVVGHVDPGDSQQVVLYARSTSDRWWGIRVVAAGPDAGEYRCDGDAEEDVSLTACTGVSW